MKKIILALLILISAHQAHAEWFDLWDYRIDFEHAKKTYTKDTLRIEARHQLIQPNSVWNRLTVPAPGIVIKVMIYRINGGMAGYNSFILGADESTCQVGSGPISCAVKGKYQANGKFCLTEINPDNNEFAHGCFGERYRRTDFTDCIRNIDVDIVAPDVDLVLDKVKSQDLRVNAMTISGENVHFDIEGSALFRTTNGPCTLTAEVETEEDFDNAAKPHFFATGPVKVDSYRSETYIRGNNLKYESIEVR